MKKVWKNTLFLTGAGIVSLVAAWAIACLAVGNEYVLPSPWLTLQKVGELLGNGGFYIAFLSTLGRAALAFLLAFLVGGGLALAAYLFPSFEKFMRAIVAVLRALPTLAVLLLILVGASHAFAPVVVGALTLFPLLYSSTLSALQGVDKATLEMCDVYRVPSRVRVRRLYLPIALPRLLSDGIAVFSFSLKLTVSAEVLAFTYRSLGGWMQEAALAAETATVAALTLFVCLVGVLVETLGSALAKRREVEQCD